MVEELETEVAAYEYETGRQQTKLSSPTVGSFSGYTASLITAVTKLMGYLKEVLPTCGLLHYTLLQYNACFRHVLEVFLSHAATA